MKPEVSARCDAALRLAQQGFAIGQCYGITSASQCMCSDADCKNPGKHGGKGWKDQATSNPNDIRSRFVAGNPNYMVIPKAGSRLLVVDEDEPGSLEELGPLPQTFIVHTGLKPGWDRGRHLYGKLPDGIDEDELPYQWAGGEVRVGGNGGVVGPYSRHACGVSYDPVNEMPVETLPEAWVRSLIASGRQRTKVQDEARGPDAEEWYVAEGGRHSWVASKAGQLRRDGLGDEALRVGLHQLNGQRCRPTLPEEEVDEIAMWASRKEAGPEMEADARPLPRDVGTSQPPPDVDEWLIEGVLRPKAILIVASSEGVGKSYIRKEMAIRLAGCGGGLFDHYPMPRRCGVLEIDEENGRSEEYRREEQVFAALGIDRDVVKDNYFSVSFTALDLGKEGSQKYLHDQLGRLRPEVLLLDTGTSMVDDEWGSEFKAAMRFLRALTVRHNCAIVVFVHLTKPFRQSSGSRRHGSSLSDVMGQWTRTVDAVAVIADLGKGRAKWSMHKKVPRSELIIAQDDGLWRITKEEPITGPSSVERVLSAIHAGGHQTGDIAVSLGISSRSVSTAIRKLRDQELLAQTFPYRLTKKGLEAVQ